MEPKDGHRKKKILVHWILLLLNCLALSIGTTSGPLLLRFYFLHGGSRRWLSAWLQTAGWPILILPLWISYKKQPNTDNGNHVTLKICLACCVIGLLTGLNDYMYAWGASYLPVSTSALLNATQLAFNAVFAFLLVRQKFSPYSINAVVLLTVGSALLAFHTNSDRPRALTTKSQYVLGFLLTISSGALSGFISPMIELVYKKSDCRVTYSLAMEMQVIMSVSATLLCTIGMVVNKDFQAIYTEAKASDVGEVNFYMGLVWNAISWQLFFTGVFGVIFLSSSLLSGVLKTVFIPVTQVLAVLIYHEKFSGEKGMALVLALWGFTSYVYGERRNTKEASNITEENQKRRETARALESVVEDA